MYNFHNIRSFEYKDEIINLQNLITVLGGYMKLACWNLNQSGLKFPDTDLISHMKDKWVIKLQSQYYIQSILVTAVNRTIVSESSIVAK